MIADGRGQGRRCFPLTRPTTIAWRSVASSLLFAFSAARERCSALGRAGGRVEFAETLGGEELHPVVRVVERGEERSGVGRASDDRPGP